MVLLVTTLSAVIMLAARLRRSESNDEEGSVPLAYLILQDESFTGHAITKIPRIGRDKNSDLTLSDTQFARHDEAYTSQEPTVLVRTRTPM